MGGNTVSGHFASLTVEIVLLSASLATLAGVGPAQRRLLWFIGQGTNCMSVVFHAYCGCLVKEKPVRWLCFVWVGKPASQLMRFKQYHRKVKSLPQAVNHCVLLSSPPPLPPPLLFPLQPSNTRARSDATPTRTSRSHPPRSRHPSPHRYNLCSVGKDPNRPAQGLRELLPLFSRALPPGELLSARN